MKVMIDDVEYVPVFPAAEGKDLAAALEVRFDFEEESITVRQYLCRLLEALWTEKESFSGKRPFGNSGWEYDLYAPLAKRGYIDGDWEPDGDEFEGFGTPDQEEAAYEYVHELIKEAMGFRATKSE